MDLTTTLEIEDVKLGMHDNQTPHVPVAAFETSIVNAPPTWLKALRCNAMRILTSTEAHLLENLGAWFFTVGLM